MPNHLIMPLRSLAPAEATPDLTPDEESPFIIEFQMVQGPGFRCVAYRDQDGRWRHALNHEELFGEIQIQD